MKNILSVKALPIITVFALMLLLLATGCQTKVNNAPNISLEGAIITSGNVTTEVNATLSEGKEIVSTDDIGTSVADDVQYENASYTITGVEGDLISLKLKAEDPDGDKLEYFYTPPLSQNGLWQTKDGDAGKYLVTVTVSDGKLSTSKDVLIIINPSNKPPVIDCPKEINIKEGDTVELKCSFFDKENDPLVIEYSGWMTSTTYTTNYESAGNHKVFVTVSDGFHNVTATIDVNVENVDRAPIFDEHMKDITVTETDIVTLNPEVSDPDNDEVKLTYSEPFNSKGVWKTQIGDAGTYPITVVASDGTLTTKETFTLTVKMLNTAPVMKLIPNITVNEGDTVTLKPDVADREKDPITITYTGWMKTASYTTTYNDAYPDGCNKPGCSATYKVTVTASDGVFNVSQDVYVTVKDKNRAPEFIWP
jgi:translation initiation factor IF-1